MWCQCLGTFQLVKIGDSSVCHYHTTKRVAWILYLCCRSRIEMKFNFEFGFTKSNLIRRAFHGDALIKAYMVLLRVAIFSKEKTHNRRFSGTQIFLLSFCSIIPLRNHFLILLQSKRRHEMIFLRGCFFWNQTQI